MKKFFESKKKLIIGLSVLAIIAIGFYFWSNRNGRFVRTGDMTIARVNHVATLLKDGRVLITGGHSADVIKLIDYGYLSSAEIYDSKTGKFAKISDMNEKRTHHTATLLQDGRVLIAGGFPSGIKGCKLASAEIYDPKTNTFTKTGDMNLGRDNHAAILLKNGKVLIVGGHVTLKPSRLSNVDSFNNPLVRKYEYYGELYNPKTGKFTLTGKSKGWYTHPILTLLPDGKVLITGAYRTKISEIYDPTKNKFVQIDYNAIATPKSNDKIVFLGIGKETYPRLYNITTGEFIQPKSKLKGDFKDGTATVLNNNKVLFMGVAVYNDDGYLTDDFNAIYDLKKDNFTKIRKIRDCFGGNTATLLQNGDVLITGGMGKNKFNKRINKFLKEAELFKY